MTLLSSLSCIHFDKSVGNAFFNLDKIGPTYSIKGEIVRGYSKPITVRTITGYSHPSYGPQWNTSLHSRSVTGVLYSITLFVMLEKIEDGIAFSLSKK